MNGVRNGLYNAANNLRRIFDRGGYVDIITTRKKFARIAVAAILNLFLTLGLFSSLSLSQMQAWSMVGFVFCIFWLGLELGMYFGLIRERKYQAHREPEATPGSGLRVVQGK